MNLKKKKIQGKGKNKIQEKKQNKWKKTVSINSRRKIK